VAVGKNRRYLNKALAHLRRALWLCPLQGEAYAYLANLSFLEHAPRDINSVYFDQALRVRPNSGTVLLAAGIDAAERGDMETAIAHWKKTFHIDPQYRQEIIERLAPQAPASLLLAQFQPDLDGLACLYREYQRLNRLDQAQDVGQSYVRALEQEAASETGKTAATHWHHAYMVYKFLESHEEEALRCIQQAVDLAPNEIVYRRYLIASLIAGGQYDEAIEHVQWCLRRHPDDTAFRSQLVHARKAKMNLEHDSLYPAPTPRAERRDAAQEKTASFLR
jgi:tetratricopeptide (TPR) repeat protein